MRAAGSDKQRLSLADARANALKLDWSGNYVPPAPQLLRHPGARGLSDRRSCASYIDWTPFFATWELNGKFPAILDDAKFGEAARSLFADAQAMLGPDRAEELVRAPPPFGFWPANAEGDDICCLTTRPRSGRSPCCIRCASSSSRREGRANVALADFVAPRASGLPTTSAPSR